jgi:hypothetical protein
VAVTISLLLSMFVFYNIMVFYSHLREYHTTHLYCIFHKFPQL